MKPTTRTTLRAGALLLVTAATALSVSFAQSAPPSPVKLAIENRKAVFTLVGNNFRPIGEILRGNTNYSTVDVAKLSTRVAFLANFVPEIFPDGSGTGDTRAKSEIWSDRTAFNKRVKDFQEHTQALSKLVTSGGGDNDAFKAAAKAVAQDCKGCHDTYRSQ
jgi:cytochrome c556